MSQPSPSKSADRSPETAHSGEGTAPEAETEDDAGADNGAATDTATEDLRALYLDSDDAGDLISSLSSDTARSILVALHDRPATTSELAETVDTSVQNVRHHLDNLREADLVTAAKTRYSSKGREMDVYAPVDRPLVVVVGSENGDDETTDRDAESEGEGEGFVDSLSRFVGAVAGLAVASLLVQWLMVSRVGGEVGGVVRSPDAVGGGVAPLVAPPGLLFFAGGAVILATVSVWRYWRRNRA